MLASSAGLTAGVVAVSFANYINRSEMPCDAILWCSYLLVSLGAGPLAVRLTNFFLRVQFEQLLLTRAKSESMSSSHGLESQFAPSSVLSQIGAYLRVFCGCRPISAPALTRTSRLQKKEKKERQLVAATQKRSIISEALRSRQRAGNLAAYFLQSGFFSGIVMTILLLMAIIPGILASAAASLPYGFKGCTGCVLGNYLFLPVWVQSAVVLVLGTGMLWRIRRAPDPLGIRRELTLVWTLGLLLFLVSVLGLIDPGSLRTEGTFDYHYFGVFIIYAIQIVQCVVPVAYTYNRKSLEHFKSGYTFDQALNRPDFKQVFSQYLASEFSMENMLFLDAVQRYKNSFRNAAEDAARETAVRAVELYNTFLKDNSMLEVNVSSEQKRSVREQLQPFLGAIDSADVELPPEMDIFDVCEEEIKKLLMTDSFPRFLRSPLFDEWFRADQFSTSKPGITSTSGSQVQSLGGESSSMET
ncbi:Regulator of G-protein signaling 12 [Hondaea fermentalgiana]|uniref:Regulator of G-protein signaling 12 n=1 Tax=Hondaea fermentalgiana TaxID=2315210 RepID=A0A2R5GD41_9STRA|nr:Regulator of G-protein signaling 12 [Hondaea fermentalgiana]|eukprot:GBG26523.1 Regulator of G-protein signaling 12 [Hondaea fermentalgiana]